MYETLNYSAELYHHGILGQKWGVRRYQNADGSLTDAGRKHYGATSVKAGAHRALAKVYGINESFYSKHTKNKALASMNKHAKNAQLKKAEEAQKEADKKKIDKLEKYKTKLSNKYLKKADTNTKYAKKSQEELDDLKTKGINSKTYQKMFKNDPDHQTVKTVYDPETKSFKKEYDAAKAAKAIGNTLFPSSKMKQYTEIANRNVKVYSDKAKKYLNSHNDIMNIKIDAGMSKRSIRKAAKTTNNANIAAERLKRVNEYNKLIYGTEGKK